MFTLVSEESYEDGKLIFEEGSSGDWVYVVLSGSVEVSRRIAGKKLVVELLKEGEVFGELSFIGGSKRSATVKAIGDTTVGIIDRDTLDTEFNKLSAGFRAILVAVVRRFNKMVDRISEFDARIEPRVIKTLSVSYKDKQSFLMAYTSNISTGGLFVKTNNPLEPDEQFLLKLQLPDFPEPLKLQSQVVWANIDSSGEDKRPIGMGIKFLDTPGSDLQTLKKYVDSVMMQK